MNSLRVKGTCTSGIGLSSDLGRHSNADSDFRYRETGNVYTPQTLANYIAHKLFEYVSTSERKSKSKDLSILDPACGDGELLLAIEKNLPREMSINLFGVDINKGAIKLAKKRLTAPSKFVNTNGLCPFNKINGRGWKQLKNKLNLNYGVDCIIANPPWGADISGYKDLISKSNFFLNEGQIDSSDLFIEASLNILKKDGLMAFIIPDSLFYQDRKKLREFLLKNTRIYFIGRFGEKLFKDINRACAVIICSKEKGVSDQLIDCIRLNPEYRKKILAGKLNFHEAETDLSHKINQNRFLNNKEYTFNIDLNEKVLQPFNKILSVKHSLKNYLTSSRGVELSKKGEVIFCINCNSWSPLPKKEKIPCNSCGKTLRLSTLDKTVIIHNKPTAKRKKLIVGEDIQRNKCQPSRWIDTGKKGINYKNGSLYEGDKIVVRKTGVGISSAIDYKAAYTNQVVYIFKLIPKAEYLPIEFFQSIISSRAIFFYICMQNGENEWRSHPYITQNQILNIPVPDTSKLNSKTQKEIKSICNQYRNSVKSGKEISTLLDAKIERMVANIYKLTKSDYYTIFSAIEEAQDLIPIKALKNISIDDIF